ncbi:TPA: hypothetical protein DCL30_01955, partial [Candidatus Peribacteria bacterium]|nr:hypothetical protein [Candidatus Peribacteria bacterium]
MHILFSRATLAPHTFPHPLPMKIIHLERGFSYSDAQRLTLARKLSRLATYCKRLNREDSVVRIESEMQPTEKNRDQILISITVELPGKNLRAESRKRDPIEAVDRCMEKLEPQLKKYKELKTRRGRVVGAPP